MKQPKSKKESKSPVPPMFTKYGFAINPDYIKWCFEQILLKK